MASLNSASAQDTDKIKKKPVITENEFIDLSYPFRPFLSEPSKLLYDYTMEKEGDPPEILDRLFNTINLVDGVINIETFYEIINEILPFDSRTNRLHDEKIQKVCDGIIAMKDKERLKLLSKDKVKYIPTVENTFKDLCESYSEIQIEIGNFKCKELPEAVTEVGTSGDKGFMCLNLFKYHKMVQRCIDLCNHRSVILRKMEEFRYSVDYLIKLTNPKTLPMDEPESEILVVRRHNKKIVSVEKMNYKEANKEVEKIHLENSIIESKKETKKGICRLEHNTPFCKNCSWQTSWLKNFKKKGVYIKEVDNSDSSQIWYNK